MLDRKRLLQMLANAIKFTPDGGRITIGARPSAAGVEFFVADTGIGVAASSAELIFDRFHQADGGIARRFGGLGIGLSVVKNLADMQGGSVRVESGGENRGATFVLTFPIAQHAPPARAETPHAVALVVDPGPAAPAPRPPPEFDPKGWRGAFRVLVVDDNADTLQIMRRLLTRAGYEIAVASGARAALALAKDMPPDALVSDLGMPDCDGFELLRLWRASPSLARVPAVAVSGFTGEAERDTARASGFNAYFIKPLDLPLLIETLDELLRAASGAGSALRPRTRALPRSNVGGGVHKEGRASRRPAGRKPAPISGAAARLRAAGRAPLLAFSTPRRHAARAMSEELRFFNPIRGDSPNP